MSQPDSPTAQPPLWTRPFIAIPWVPLISVIMVLRTLQGIAWAMANTSASTVAADVIPKARFGEGIGYFGLSSSIAMSFAPALSLVFCGNSSRYDLGRNNRRVRRIREYVSSRNQPPDYNGSALSHHRTQG